MSSLHTNTTYMSYVSQTPSYTLDKMTKYTTLTGSSHKRQNTVLRVHLWCDLRCFGLNAESLLFFGFNFGLTEGSLGPNQRPLYFSGSSSIWPKDLRVSKPKTLSSSTVLTDCVRSDRRHVRSNQTWTWSTQESLGISQCMSHKLKINTLATL